MSVHPVSEAYLADMRTAAEEFRAECAGIRRYLRAIGGWDSQDLAREMDGAHRRYDLAREVIWEKHFPQWPANDQADDT